MSDHTLGCKLRSTMDAQVWAREFMAVLDAHLGVAVDEGLMLTWFANAIMCGYDHGVRKQAFADSKEPKDE